MKKQIASIPAHVVAQFIWSFGALDKYKVMGGCMPLRLYEYIY